MTTYTTIQLDERHIGSAKPLSRHLPAFARLTLGAIFFFFGLVGILSFAGVIPIAHPSTPLPEAAASFSAALMSAGYMFPLIKGTELVCGAMLLSNRFVPLALAVVAPVVVNIVAFHAFLAPSGLGLALIVLTLEVYSAWTHRRSYRPMLAARAPAIPARAPALLAEKPAQIG